MKKSKLFTKMMHVCLILTMLLSMIECDKSDMEAFFQGQKSAEEVAKIIQSRAMIYVSENM